MYPPPNTVIFLGCSESSSASSDVMHRSAPGRGSLVGLPPTATNMFLACRGDGKQYSGSRGGACVLGCCDSSSLPRSMLHSLVVEVAQILYPRWNHEGLALNAQPHRCVIELPTGRTFLTGTSHSLCIACLR
eukprot:GHUV01029047.1.p1 GENE.GHUV01029047.1~~GHUV01029047.1.p1  ORF type:complete len:132 (+),score=8.28 GHUV01029047.1:1064-1459(+)